MIAVNSATPLIALDAVVIDLETTGLDPSRASIVEIAALRIASGRIAAEPPARWLVRPPEPIPAQATLIHGIDDATVAAMPPFAEIWPRVAAFLGGGLLIGHTIGFDLTVLKRECGQAKIPWTSPPALDTRLLAEIAEPHLAGYTLEKLGAWLDIEIEGRHSASGDALTTARIFRALLPKLRDSGIRTLGEAMQACRALTDALESQHRAVWTEAQAPARFDATGALRGIDSYPYRHRCRDVMRSPPQFIAADASLREALTPLMEKRISSLFVQLAGAGDAVPPAAQAGIVTERDILRVLSERGPAAFEMPVDRIASRPLVCVSADAFVYLAIGRMNRMKIRHLGVVDDSGVLCGALSARDLLRLRAAEAVALDDELDHAQDTHDLARAWTRLPHVVSSLLAEGVSGRDIAAVISSELGALTRRAALLAERRMHAEGRGGPPCLYAFAVLGSAGRGESLLAMDQDNALVFAQGAPGGAEDRWFESLGVYVADILHEVGVPYCKGGVMARNPQWRGSLDTWQMRIGDWISRADPQDLLSVDIFFDLRGAHGEVALAETIWRSAFDKAKGEVGFAKLLAEAAGTIEPGLGLFRRFRTQQGRIDLKKSGLFGIVTTARVLAICHHVVERATPARLSGLATLDIGGDRDFERLNEAHAIFIDLILAQQIKDIAAGLPPSNRVAVKRLNEHDWDRLRYALDAVRNLDEFTRDMLFGA